MPRICRCLCVAVGFVLMGVVADGRQLDRNTLQPSEPSVQTAEEPGELELEEPRDELREGEEARGDRHLAGTWLA